MTNLTLEWIPPKPSFPSGTFNSSVYPTTRRSILTEVVSQSQLISQRSFGTCSNKWFECTKCIETQWTAGFPSPFQLAVNHMEQSDNVSQAAIAICEPSDTDVALKCDQPADFDISKSQRHQQNLDVFCLRREEQQQSKDIVNSLQRLY